MDLSVQDFNGIAANRYAKGYRVVKCDGFDSIKRYIEKDCWCPVIFQNNYRLKSNFMYVDLLGIDFDEGPTLDDTISLLKDFGIWCIVGTSKSHGLIKKTDSGVIKPARDRFRVVLKLEHRIMDLKTYEQNLTRIIKALGSDQSCKDGARFYYPCKEIVYCQDGLPIKVFQYQPPRISAKSAKSKYDETLCKLVPQWMEKELRRGVIDGERNRKAFIFSCRLKERRFTEQDAFDILSPYIRLDESELKRTIRQAYKY